ncbi:MAG: tRNA (N(6)-L-threonylcarbamoyladenosine(37)-C(2))-methylthiotransferase MtaB [Vulcanimicrobiota bacterium]
MKKKFFKIVTLGCKVNQYESDKIKSELVRRGLAEAAGEQEADFYIVNTCIVTREAGRKSRQLIRRGFKTSHPVKVYALGCAVDAGNALEGLPSEVIMLNNCEKELLPGIIAQHREKNNNDSEPGGNRTRALLKIQEGCDNFCSYCIIPHVRGRSRSREPGDILAELKQLEEMGYGEVVLTGIHMGDYGKKISRKLDLAGLIKFLLRNSSIKRLRLSSLEPMDFSFDIIDLFGGFPAFCRHLHLSLQHASNKILKLMNRNYSIEEYDKIVRTAISKYPQMAITTDIIVGFPGETAEDFQLLYDYLQKSPIYMAHIFPFSLHLQTKAAGLKGFVTGDVKRERLNLLMELREIKIKKYLDKFLNRNLEILVEQEVKPGLMMGHTGNYLPVVLPGKKQLVNEFIKVNIIKRMEDRLYGEKA